jgi:Telomere capping, CST complex subunit
MGALKNGIWVNVIGYVESEEESTEPRVRAVMLWPAPGVDLGNYEQTLSAMMTDDF